MGRIDLNSLNGIKYNGVEVDGLKINGVTVFETEYPITYIPTSGSSQYRTWADWGFLLKSNGNYPTSYKSSVGATIDTPYTSEREKPNNGGTFKFYGYFKDITCTESFNGIIPPGTKGEVIIYAKIKMTATPFY